MGAPAEPSFAVEVLTDGPERLRCEHELDQRLIPLPLFCRSAASGTPPGSESVLLALRHHQGGYVTGFAVRSRPAPYLRGHVLLDADHFGQTLAPNTVVPAVDALAEYARSNPRVLRVRVRVFSRDPGLRSAVGDALAAQGFSPAREDTNYTKTLAIDLTPSEEHILRGFHHSARRNIRKIEKLPVAVRPVLDVGLAERIEDLMHETLERTGGLHRPQDWRGRILLSREHPERSRIAGLFDRERSGPEALLAFAWGCHNGDHVQYSDAASTRETRGRVPLSYPLMWDLITWAKRHDALWFDLGGVTPGTLDNDDPLGGISDFKRFFSGELLSVAEDWEVAPSLRARAVRTVYRWLR